MAAYAATVTSTMSKPEKISAVTGLRVFCGEVNITNYNQTLAAITGISGKFKTIYSVVAGVSDNGHIFEWVDASNAFKVYHADYDAVADGPLIQAASDTDAGSAHFIAIGHG